jgi:hypothetical protein
VNARAARHAHRARTSTRSTRNRRGAIVVMTGIFIVAIMVIGAISVDASRIFAAKNELQTAADAAALAGAVQLLEDSSTALDTARAVGFMNRVEQKGIDSMIVEPGVWFPAERDFQPGPPPWNAVRVTVSHGLPLSLARVFGDSTVTVMTSAVAWSSAPVVETGCSKPLAVPYGRLLDILGYPSWVPYDITDDDLRRLREMPIAQRQVELPYSSHADDTTWYNLPNDDEYFPVDIDSSWVPGDPLNHGRDPISEEDFRSYMDGTRCSRTVRPGDEVRSEPGDKRNAIRDGIESLCEAEGGEFVADWRCEVDGNPIDIPMKVLFWQDDGISWDPSPSRALLRTKITGSFVFQEMWDFGGADPETAAALRGYFDIVRDFGVVDDTAPSTIVRPVLVR